jgi:hypothetical protein
VKAMIASKQLTQRLCRVRRSEGGGRKGSKTEHRLSGRVRRAVVLRAGAVRGKKRRAVEEMHAQRVVGVTAEGLRERGNELWDVPALAKYIPEYKVVCHTLGTAQVCCDFNLVLIVLVVLLTSSSKCECGWPAQFS